MERFLVFNATDGIYASPDIMTSEQADDFIKAFPERYRWQGYYRTNNWDKIDPKDVVLKKVPVDPGVHSGDAGDVIAAMVNGMPHDDPQGLLDEFNNPGSTPMIDDEDELMDRQRGDGDYPFCDFACLWDPGMHRLLWEEENVRLPFIEVRRNTII